MERRGEGFERERYVPGEGREVRREGVEREPVREPVAGERIAEPTPAVREERQAVTEPSLGARPFDLTRWGPVLAGVFVSLGIIALLGVLGAALGFQLAGPGVAPDMAATAGTAAAIWGAITLIVGFFVGGWLAGRMSGNSNSEIGLLHGVAVWAVSVVGLLILGAIGAGGLMGMLNNLGMPSGDISIAQGAAWSSFAAMLLGLAAAAAGGYLGGQYFEREGHRRLTR
jgi:hypothetical protein